jgi:hypothetical protein
VRLIVATRSSGPNMPGSVASGTSYILCAELKCFDILKDVVPILTTKFQGLLQIHESCCITVILSCLTTCLFFSRPCPKYIIFHIMFLSVSTSHSIVCLIHPKKISHLNIEAALYAETSERNIYTARCTNPDILHMNKNPRVEF